MEASAAIAGRWDADTSEVEMLLAGRMHGAAWLDVTTPAAARSANMTAWSWRTLPAGIDGSALRNRTIMSRFSLPVTNQRIRRARLMIG